MMTPKNVIVCGTNFGRFYIAALLRENPDFRLAGILAKGSERSRVLAAELNVPLYTAPEEVAGTVDIACVVLKSTLLGGPGTRVATALLKRGIHVLQEHPVHPTEIRQCREIARTAGVVYHVNSHFVNVRPVRTFIAYAREAAAHRPPAFMDVSTALLYSTLDIIGRALGTLTPYAFGDPIAWDDAVTGKMRPDVMPYKCLQGVIGGVPVTFQLQNFFDPEDVDHNYLVMHRLSIGSDSGNVSLLGSQGPVIWNQGFPVPDLPAEGADIPAEDDGSMAWFRGNYGRYTSPSSVPLTGEAFPTYGDVTTGLWPEAMLRALSLLAEEARTGTPAPGQSTEYLTDLGNLWMELMKRFGKPTFLPISPAPKPWPDPVTFDPDEKG